MRMLDVAYIALGSNIGDRAAYLARARTALASLPGSRLIAESRIEETEPVGPVAQEKYLNQMIALETTLPPRTLLAHLLEIEAAEGRTRDVRWGPRTLDLDIVRFGDRVIATAELTIPHPELAHRAFWLREIAELDTMAPAHV